jgi:predicted metal-dependent peptidase
VQNQMSRLGYTFEEHKRLAVNEMYRAHASWCVTFESQKLDFHNIEKNAERVVTTQANKICEQAQIIREQGDELIEWRQMKDFVSHNDQKRRRV